MSSLINLMNVTKSYRTGANEYYALKDIDFHLQKGEMLAVIGASGSGKSTLMNIIGFLDKATTGHYWFANENVSNLNANDLARIRNQKIGFVFQSFFLLPRLSALQNVMLPLLYRDENKIVARQKGFQILTKIGMEKFSHYKPSQLSGGQQQRVAIARALIANPEVILADEPTGSLDSETGQEIMNLFLDLNTEEKRTIVLITHDHAISRQCQRVVTLKDGKILLDAT